jgi:hypothetical protein
VDGFELRTVCIDAQNWLLATFLYEAYELMPDPVLRRGGLVQLSRNSGMIIFKNKLKIT